MIDKPVARKLLLLVNDVSAMSMLQEYVEFRLSHLRKQLEECSSIELPLLQGQIRELRRFSKLREEVIVDSR